MPPTEKKRLLIIITKSNFGGAQRYVYDLSRSLKDRYTITVACGGEGLMKTRIEALGIRIAAIPSLERNVNFFKDIAVFFWLLHFLRKERPNIMHVNSSKIGGVGALAGRIMGTRRIIFTAHAWAFNEDRGLFSKFAITFLHWLTVMLSHETIAVSNAVKKQMHGMPFVDKKITVIHLGLESADPASRIESRIQLKIPENVFAIGTIAELHPIKGLDFAIEAVKKAPFDCTYSIIGEGDERTSLEARIASDPVTRKRIVLKGFVADAARFIPAFDIFLLPSLSEAFGYVLLEAGLANVPVIATSVGGIPEIIEDMKSGVLIHSQSSKEILRAINFLYEGRRLGEKLALELNDKTKKEFSLSKMVENTVAVYEK